MLVQEFPSQCAITGFANSGFALVPSSPTAQPSPLPEPTPYVSTYTDRRTVVPGAAFTCGAPPPLQLAPPSLVETIVDWEPTIQPWFESVKKIPYRLNEEVIPGTPTMLHVGTPPVIPSLRTVPLSPTAQPALVFEPQLLMKTAFRLLIVGLDCGAHAPLWYLQMFPLVPTAHPSPPVPPLIM